MPESQERLISMKKVSELTQEEISQLMGISKDRIMDEIINAHMCGQVCAGLDPSYFEAKKHVESIDLFKRD